MQSPAPSEYFENIKFNYSFYTAKDSNVTLEYVNNNFLRCTGYAYSRSISTTFNGIIYALGGIETTDITATGTITANLFQGSGTELTNLNASNISDGTLAVPRGGTGLSTLASGQLLIGNDTGNIAQSVNLIWDIQNNNLGIGKNPAQKLDVNGTVAATLFSGSGASLTGLTEGQIPALTAAKIPDLDAAKITSGTISNDRITLTAAKIPDLDAAKITSGTISNDRITLTADKIPDLDAAKITSGTISNDRITLTAAKIPDLDTAKITSGTISNDRITLTAAKIPDLNADKITTGTINNDRIALTTTKVFQHFNDKTFVIKDDKIDLSRDVGSYTFNILAYDRMFESTAPSYSLSGKFTCSYEDRTGIYTLRPSETITNKLILDYKVGDKLIFKNTALKTWDYLNDTNAFGQIIQRWGKLTVFKIANGTNWTGQGEEAYMTKIFEWRSETNQLIDYTQSQAVFPWATTMTLTIETGFRYFLIKWWYNVDANYYITPASEESQMNNSNYGGQGFKMISTYLGSTNYIPQTPATIPVMTTTTHGVALRGARLSLDTETATLSADIPTTTELLSKMNTSHFKIDVSSSLLNINTDLAELKGPKGDDGTNGKGWTDGTYDAATGILTFASDDALGFNTSDIRGGKGDKGDDGDDGTNGKGWTGATYSATTGKVSFASNDGTAYVFDTGDLRGGTGANGKGWTGATYSATTGKVSFASNDGTSYVFDTGDLRGASGATLTATQLSALMNTTDHFTLNGTKIDFKTTYKIPTAGTADTLATSRNIAGVAFNGSANIDIPYANLTNKLTAGTNINIDASNVISASGGGQWITTGTTNSYTTGNVAIGQVFNTTIPLDIMKTNAAGQFGSLDMMALKWDADNSLRIAQNWVSAGVLQYEFIQKTAGTDVTAMIIRGGRVGIGTTTVVSNVLQVGAGGRLRIANSNTDYTTIGSTDIDGATNTSIVISGSARATNAGNIQYVATSTGKHIFNTGGTTERMTIVSTGNVGIGTTDPTNKLHIRDDTINTTALTIQNNFTGGLPTEIVVAGTTFGPIGTTERFISFTYTTTTAGYTGQTLYTITLNQNYVCDILIVGGGGGGGQGTYENGGGGGGGLLYMKDKTFTTGTYKIIIGDGGVAATIGYDSKILKSDNTNVIYDGLITQGKGGGAGGGGAGGSGGGGNKNGGAGSATQGLTFWNGSAYVAGGFNGQNGGSYSGGGAGGSSEPGGTDGGLEGGDGRMVNITGQSVFYGGGGAGGGYGTTTGGDGGAGGTGNWGSSGGAGTPNTGGGGGGAYSASTVWGGKGGSGIVIIRYRQVPTKTSCIELINGTTTDVNTDYTLGNYNSIFKVFAKVENLSNEVLTIDKTTLQLGVPYGITTNSTITASGSISAGSISASSYLQGSGGGGAFRFVKPDGWVRLRDSAETTHLDFAAGQLYAHSTITSIGTITCPSISCSGNINGIGVRYDGLVASGTNQAIRLAMTGTGAFVVTDTGNNTKLQFITDAGGNSYGEVLGDWYVNGYGNEIYSYFRAVSQTNTDHLVVQRNYAENEINANWIKVGYGSFTAFHRCYTDDELYNNENNEDIDIFKNKYVGCVVIATGKIKTDFTRKIQNEPIDEPVAEPINRPAKKEIDEWYSEIDKDGITVEDAVPVVRLSRQRKDKRVFGVFGGIRSTNNKDRLIVNSVGEGGISVSNTNGNIENGDYIQSSDLLGYGEKQDDDLLHNYTIAKATIDCNFELDSPYYQCHEIENGVRVAFIACTYHCG